MTFEEKTISSETIYEGAILKLRRDKVTTINGTSYREIVEHMGGAVIAALDEENNIYMVKQFRKAVERDVLELPAGKIELNEDPLVTAVRELQEETGIRAKEITHLTDIWPTVGYSGEKLYIYQAKGLSFGECHFDDSEALDMVKYPLDQVVAMIMNGQILDAKTIVGVLMVKQLQLQELSE